jgi:hypothetical protein
MHPIRGLRFSRSSRARPTAHAPQAFGPRQRLGRRADGAQGLGRHPRQRGALEKVQHRQARGEPRRARRGQHVVRPADIVADGLGRPLAEEDRAGMGDLARKRLGVGDAELQVLGRDPVGAPPASSRSRTVMTAPKSRQLAPRWRAVPASRAASDRRGHGLAEAGVVGDQDRLRAFVMLGLAHQVEAIQSGSLSHRRSPGSRRGPRSCRCRPCRRPAAWPRPHRRCRGR